VDPLEPIDLLVFDDGSQLAVEALYRAAAVASSMVVASAPGSENPPLLAKVARRAGIVADQLTLPKGSDVRDALEVCIGRGIAVAVVPHPGQHPGRLLRKCVQAAAAQNGSGRRELAVHIVVHDAAPDGPIILMSRSSVGSGSATRLAVRMAIATECELALVRLPDAGDEQAVRQATALAEAHRLVEEHRVRVRNLTIDTPDPATIARAARGARAVVFEFGGFDVHGRKLLAPDELPDRVLESPDGRILHEIARDTATDLVVVIGAVTPG
jgi:hypothetical protein